MGRFSESILASSTGTILGQDPTVNLGFRGWDLGIISLRDHLWPMMDGKHALATEDTHRAHQKRQGGRKVEVSKSSLGVWPYCLLCRHVV
jgi:hypothetical protein